MSDTPSEGIRLRTWLGRAVVLSALAGLIHLLLTPLYFQQWLGYGAFFFGAATLQVMYGAVLAISRPRRWLFWVGIAGNGAIILLWAITRTIGVPFFGPDAGEVQPVGVPDLISKLVEAALVVHLAVLLRALPQGDRRPLIE